MESTTEQRASNSTTQGEDGEINTRDAAKRYTQRGWSVVPVPAKEKGPKMPDWQKGGFKPEDFSPTQNIGLILDRSNLTDVDYDSEEAAQIGHNMLPATVEAGRGGKLRKAFYRMSLDKLYYDVGRYEDGKFKREKIMEVRSKGKQAVVSPSIHPSGERYEWLHEGGIRDLPEPTEIAPEELERLCDRIAASTLVARHLPQGSRHDLALAYAGFMIRKLVAADMDMEEAKGEVLDILTPAWEYHNAPPKAFNSALQWHWTMRPKRPHGRFCRSLPGR